MGPERAWEPVTRFVMDIDFYMRFAKIRSCNLRSWPISEFQNLPRSTTIPHLRPQVPLPGSYPRAHIYPYLPYLPNVKIGNFLSTPLPTVDLDPQLMQPVQSLADNVVHPQPYLEGSDVVSPLIIISKPAPPPFRVADDM